MAFALVGSTRAGTPTTVAYDSTAWITTAPAPTIAPSPISTWQNHRTDTYVRVRSDPDCGAEHSPWRNMAVVPKAIVLNNGAGVDDAVQADAGLRIDDGPGHDNSFRP